MDQASKYAMTSSKGYEWRLVLVLGLAVGLMSFEQQGVSYLMPFIQPFFNLSNTQVGLLSSGYWLSFAISSFAVGSFAEARRQRQFVLTAILALFAILSIGSGLAVSYAVLLVARVVMGALEGPLLAISQSIVALESSPTRRGLNMGFVTGFAANILGWFVAPLLLVQVARTWGWRAGCFVVLIPGLICACAVGALIKEPKTEHAPLEDGSPIRGQSSLRTIIGYRNVWLCAALCCFFIAFLGLGLSFLPLFYVNVRHFTAPQMASLMGVLGIAAVLYAVLVPFISDRIGRKPVMVIASVLGVMCPMAAVYYTGSTITLALLLFTGWSLSGTASLFMGTIPSETVPAQSVSSAIGFIVAVGVITGGLLAPASAGWCADRWGLQVPLYLEAGCAAAAVLASLALVETSPRKQQPVLIVAVAH